MLRKVLGLPERQERPAKNAIPLSPFARDESGQTTSWAIAFQAVQQGPRQVVIPKELTATGRRAIVEVPFDPGWYGTQGRCADLTVEHIEPLLAEGFTARPEMIAMEVSGDSQGSLRCGGQLPGLIVARRVPEDVGEF